MSQLKVNSIVPVGGLPSGATGGGIIQCVQTVRTDVQSTSSMTFVDLLTLSITPSQNSSKILLMYKVPMSAAVNGYSGMVRLVRGSTAIYIGDSYTSNTRASSQAVSTTSNGDYRQYELVGQFIDSPATTSATTYKVQFRNDYSGYTVFVGRTHNGNSNDYYATTPHNLIAMEVTG
mgnify:CR=1 FL=1|tara:strand:+ start:374 stop:901 length:528 start_codon:yes stop_codon:yes gene_type:complete